MKPNPTLKRIIPSVIAGLALACWPDTANAQTATIPMPPGAIQPGGDPTDTTLDWGIFWNGFQGADGIATELFDPTVSSSSSIPGSIHVNIFLPGNTASNAPAGAANLCFGNFITPIGYNTWPGANQSSAVDFSRYSALSFDILVNINTSSNTAIPINLYSWDWSNVQIGSVPIPAMQGWQHISIPIPNAFSFNDPNAPPPNGTAWGFYNWYPNNDPACSDFWIDNVQLVAAGVIPPGLGSLPARPIFVGQTLELLFTAGDPAQAASISSVTAVSSDQTLVADGSIQVSGSGSARTLSLTANPSHSGTANITIMVNYSSGTPASVSGSFPVTVLPADGSVFIREMFQNIPGTSVADLTQNPAFPKQPDLVQVLRAFEAPQNVGDNYGQRLYGYLAPPVAGPYVFYIASDDQSILYLSTDSSPANKVQIATEPGWNGSRQWITGDNQVSRGNPPVNISAPITLTAGQAYYIEALHKQGGGGDNLAVAWQLPGAPAPANGDPPLPWVPPSGVFSSDFNQFNPLWPPLGTWLNGSATTYDDSTGGTGGSGVLKLTTALPGQQSTFVIDDLNGGQPIGGFIATFKLRMGGGTTPPADGFSFNFAPDIDTAALFSEEGGGSGLTVSFDTYDNGNEAPALDIDWAGQLVARQWFSGWGSAGRDLFKDPAGNPVSLETGDAFEDVRIELKPNGTVTVQYKGLTIHDNVFIPNYAPTHGRFALAARTGGSTDNQFVDDLSITTTPVSSAPASILQPPQSQTVNEQGSVTFALLPGGGAPFTFQWFRDNVAINGATASSYTIASVSASDNGAVFTVRVTNAGGSTTSAPAVLTVRRAEVLFADNFTVSASSVGVNFEYNAGRQSGSVSPLLYSEQSGAPGQIQVNNPDSPGHLRLQPVSSYRYPNLSPNHNFTESGHFFVEFDLNTGIDDDVSPSGDYWASVVIGATSPNQYATTSDGFGVLFRNHAGYAVFDGSTFVQYAIPGASFPDGLLPLGEFHVRLDVTAANFQGSPATITMHINGIEVPIGTWAGNEYVKQTGFAGNWITLGADGDPTITRTDTIDNLSVTAFPCIEASQRQPFLILGDNPDHLRVSLPPWMNQSQAVSVTLTSQNPTIAVPMGGSGGTITLNFPAGSATEQMVSVAGVAAGTTQFVLSTPDGFCVGDPESVTVGGIAGSPVTLVNPSFEADTFTVWPGYAGAGNGAITGWSGGGGINPVSGLNPFADNGQIPDGNQVAFIQGAGSLSQTIGGFTLSAPYYLRYRENARNCCGGALPSMKATMDGFEIVDDHTVTPVGGANPYHVVTSAKFLAAHTDQVLSFVATSSGGGDSTALIDFVEVVPVAGPFVRSYAPVGGDLPTDSLISIVLEDGLTEVDPSSIQLTLDGTLVSPVISKDSDLTTMQFSPPGWFAPLSHHVVSLSFRDNNSSPTTDVHAFAFDVGVLSTASGDFFIEAEDFNFGSGQHQAAADTMPYLGGAYNGLGAVQGVDYSRVAPGAPANTDLYRTGEDPNVGIVGNTDSSRGSFNVTSGYKVVWISAGDWFNYTRNFPSGTYNLYGRLASGGVDEHARLDLVTSGATTPNQSLVKLGNFDAPATGSYETFGFVPLRTDSGQLAVVNLNGLQTLRFTVLPDNFDFNYLALVPAAAPAGPAPALISVFAFNGNQIRATFDQMLDPGSAMNPSHYAIAGASVTSAMLSTDAKTILLTVSGLSGGGVTLTVNGVVGASGLSVPPGTSLAGSVSPLTPLDIAPAASGAAAGSLTPQSAQDFDVIAGGNNIGGNQDGFHFDYQQSSGDFDAVVHVTRLDNSGAYAIAGLMIRQNTTPGSPEASVGLEPSQGNNNNRVQLRAFQDGPTTDWGFNSAASTQPWLRLKRLGNELFAYRSPDGVSWTKLGQTTQAFTDPVLVGLATSPGSFAPGATTVANYRGYTLSANPARILQIVAMDAYASRAGADPGLFKISLFGQRAAPFLISYAISGTAQNGVDYEPIPNSVTIPAGQSSVYIAIKPAPDGLAQGFKNVTLTLPPVAGAETELASATVGLFDDQLQPGYLMREVYRNLSLNGPVADLTSAPAFPNSPNQADLVSSIESPTVAESTLGEGYGQRLSGYLIPPTDGNYTFYICSDDSSELWLSTDENPAHKALIASEPQWNPARQWTGAYNQASRGTPPSNVSAMIPLLGAHRYYIEILHKQGGGGNDLAVAWQKPGDPLPANGSDPIGSAYLEVRVPLSISGLTPAGVQSGGGDFTLVVNGTGFVDGATLLWGGTARTTTVSGPRQLMAVIPASDIVAGAELRTAIVTVQNPGGEISNPLAFTIGTAAMSVADSAVAPAGGTVLVSTAPADASSPGVQAGVSAAFNHADGAGPATISAVTYSSNPAAGTLFDTGAGFVDLQVAGAQPNDSLAANFYYPSSITSPVEDTLVLLYFNGTVWGPVLSSGGASPAKDTTDNLDGTVSGGRFSVVFDNTSTPPITGMRGTVFAPTTPAVASDKTPPLPDAASLPTITGQCSATISAVPTATDDVTGKVQGTTTDPLTYTAQGTYIVTWHYNDGNGNVSSQTQTVIVKDTTPPQIVCPANLTVPCNVNLKVPVTFTVTATDNCDPAPVVTCSPASGSGFLVGTTTVNCTARDANGNQSARSFTVTRTPLGFTGFLSPIGGADATGGSYASPIQTSKTGSTIPVKFTASCGGSQVVTGTHRLQVVHYTSASAAGNPIDATAQDSATTGDQFRLAGGQWIFNLDTKATGMSSGVWLLRATLSDGSQHSAWIQLK